MRIIIFSDVHGSYFNAEEVISQNKDVEIFIFLGDGLFEVERLKQKYSQKMFLSVKGNCDFGYAEKEFDFAFLGGKKILYTHGHNFGVKSSVNRLFYMAKENECDIALFGHTHSRFNEYQDGVYIFNPSSVTLPRDGKKRAYGFLDITPAGIVLGHKEI